MAARYRVDRLALLGRDQPGFDAGFSSVERTSLGDDAWVEYRPELVTGHMTLFEELAATAVVRRSPGRSVREICS